MIDVKSCCENLTPTLSKGEGAETKKKSFIIDDK
jgi:hypothetical protein